MIFCPATPSPDETAQMIYGGWLDGSSAGSSVFTRPQQTQPKLGYSPNVKGLSQTNKFNHGLTSPAGCFNTAGLQRSLMSLLPLYRQTQMQCCPCGCSTNMQDSPRRLVVLFGPRPVHKSQVLKHNTRVKCITAKVQTAIFNDESQH